MSEAGLCGAQDAFAQDPALRKHDRERRIVADRADIAEVICQALKLGHQRAQIDRARRHLNLQRGLHGARKRDCISDGAVTGGAPGKMSSAVERRPGHQTHDSLVHVSEPLLQAHDRLAIRGETKMAGLNDARMNWTDGNLVETLALRRQELIWRALSHRR